MTAAAALLISAIGVSGIFALDSDGRALLAVVLIAALCVRARRLAPFGTALFLILVFCGPLILIHALFNVQFPVDGEAYGVPYRSAGVAFGYESSTRIALYVVAALAWYQQSRDYLIDLLASFRAPIFLVAIVAQSISVVGQFPRQASKILLAQRSRGLALGAGPVGRLRALVTVVIPLISKLLLEAVPRSVALTSRGFASGPMSAPPTAFAARADAVLAAVCLLSLALIRINFGG